MICKKIAVISFAVLGLCGCSNLTQEQQEQIKQETSAAIAQAGEAWDQAQTAIAEELSKIDWANDIFRPQTAEDKKLTIYRKDGTVAEDTNTFIENLQVSQWQKQTQLPEGLQEQASFDLRQDATLQLGDTVSNTNYKIAQLTVYTDRYVSLEILESMTKYMDIVIPKENFTAVYQVPEEVEQYLCALAQ